MTKPREKTRGEVTGGKSPPLSRPVRRALPPLTGREKTVYWLVQN